MSKLTLSSSPHLHDNGATRKIMLDVIIATFPAIIASGFIFGFRAILVIFVSVISAVIAEYITEKLLKKSPTICDLSAIVTGILLAFCLPVDIPLWMASLGAVISIVIVKQFFGGIGQNFANPAIVGRIVLSVSFPTAFSVPPVPIRGLFYDAVTSSTPLTTSQPLSFFQSFLGFHAGTIGETCILALFLGGIYLIIKRVISPVIPLFFLGTTFAFVALAGSSPLVHLLSGGLVLGAIFMATDYSTSPITNKGKIIYAIGCGLITATIRIFGAMPGGVSYAILLMNILTPQIEKMTKPKVFGSKEVSRT